MIGTTISHYNILEKLGEGGMGVVYKARDIKLDRIVALKFLPRSLSTTVEESFRFSQEARALSTLNHPHIATIHEFDDNEGQKFIALEYLEGGTLKQKLRAGKIPFRDAIEMGIQIAEGLAHAHAKGLVHRDLKSENIMLTSEGLLKITDFGLAKFADGSNLTRTGMTVGTAAYMSPEQALGVDVDHRSDIFSLGVVLYEVITGQLPFKGEHPAALMYEIVNVTPTPIKQLCADVPDRLANIIDRMLEKQPENRFQNSQEIVTELTELGKLIDAGGDLRGSKSSITLHLPSFLQKRSARLMAIAFLVILIPCIWYIYNHRKSSPAEMDRSIAVLPLLNVGDTTNAYLAGGLTDDIIMDFSRLPQAMLIFAEKTAAGGHPQMADSAIASNLGVRYLLKGEAQFSRSMAKLHASIYDHRADKEIWSTDYEQPRTGLFDMKRTLIADVASQLGISSPAPSSRLHTPSPEVYESYLHGLSDRDRTTKEDMRMAREYLREAVSKDSLYVDGLVRLARSLVESNVSGWDKSPSGLTEAAALCRKALQLDSTNAEAYGVLGYIIEKSDDRDKGIAYLQKCLELDKSSSFALTALGIIYMSELNEPAKGVVYLKRLQELQPTDWLIAQNLGVGYGQLKDYAGAKTAFRRAMQLNPDHEWPMMNMGYVCERLGDLDSALSYYLLALQKHNKSLPVYENFSSVSLAMKKYQLAESTLAIGTRAMPGEYMMNYWLGVAYSLDSKQQAADAAFKEGVLIIKTKLGSNLEASECHSDLALFYARLKNEPEALKELAISMKLDSSMFIKAAQIYAVLGMKDKMLLSFRKARQMSPEWDDAFLATAIDFANYRNDPDLLALAREE